MKKYNGNAATWFILVGDGLDKVSRGGSHSFKGYTDHAGAHNKGNGAYIEYVTSRDEKGRDKAKWFTLNESFRKFQVREGENDINRITQYDFLKFSPDCEGSPNGTYVEVNGEQTQQGIMFRELNSDKDAQIALDAEMRVNKAKLSALELDDSTLVEIAANIGVYGEPGQTMRLRVLEFAGKRPVDYFSLLNSGDRAIRAIVRKSLADGVFTQKGTIIYWESTVIGSNEDEAVANLLQNKQMLDALQNKTKLGTEAKAETPANKGGRPKGSTTKK